MKLGKCDTCHKDWVWPDAEKDVSFISSSVDNNYNDLATHGIFSIDDLCDDQEGASSSVGKREANLTFSL
jgi:hypothetical protein